ncbi:MAG: aldo/keto reductase [Candidatus Latescibacterota bacterium]
MRYRTLGKTGLRVSELSLGGLFVSSVGGAFEQGRAAIRRALDLGVNYVDTAPGYADSEEVLGRALEGETRPLVLSTKVGGRPRPFEPQNAAQLRQSVEESLRLLRRESVDILMIHEPDRPGQYDWWSDPEAYKGPVLQVLDELQARGLIRFTGLGGTTAYEIVPILETGRFDVLLTAFNYSLLWREAEHAVLPAAARLGMGIVVGSPLQQGALARRWDAEVEGGARWLSPPRRAQYRALYRLLDEAGMSVAEMGLRFVLSNPAVSCTLMGARSAGEVEENVAAVEKGPLPPDLLERLAQIAAMVPFRPFEEPFGLPFGRRRSGPGVAR